MSAAAPKRHPEIARSHRNFWLISKLEITGLLVIAALVLVLVLIRNWHQISWSLR